MHVTIEQFDAAVPDRVTDFNSPGEAITFVRNTGLFLGFMFFLELRVEFLAKPCLILVLDVVSRTPTRESHVGEYLSGLGQYGLRVILCRPAFVH